MKSFFSRPTCDLKTLEEYEFFLLYYGHGYTREAVRSMYLDELLAAVNRLNEQLKEEAKIRAKANERNAAANSRNRPKYVPRR